MGHLGFSEGDEGQNVSMPLKGVGGGGGITGFTLS